MRRLAVSVFYFSRQKIMKPCRPIFRRSLSLFLPILALALIAGAAAITTAWAGPATALVLTDVNDKSPDYVVVTNQGSAAADLSGYTLVEDDAAWTFPAGTTLAPGESVKVFCYSKKKKLSAGQKAAEEYKDTPGVLVSIEFGISSDEVVELKDPSGKVVSKINGNQ